MPSDTLANTWPDDHGFRQDVRAWFESEYARFCRTHPVDDASSLERRRAWEDHVCRSGWSGLGWPRALGGRELSLARQAIFHEEQARIGAPLGVNIIGHGILAPTLIHHGSPAQQRRFLPRILSNEEIWCQGYSESEAGSDLASLRCNAVQYADHFLLTGHKIWTSFAHIAQWCFVLARTDMSASRHRGLSMLLVDMSSPGIRVEPIAQLNGSKEFNQVVFDRVRVPRDLVLGELGQGWKVAMAAASFERATYFIPRQVRFEQELLALRELAAASAASGARRAQWRNTLARLAIDSHVLKLKTARSLEQASRGHAPGPEGSSTKVHWSEAHQRLLGLAMEILGPRIASGSGDRLAADWTHAYLSSRAETILAGTSEIQRNIIGEQILKLPRG